MMYLKFHRSYSTYFATWYSLPYTNDDNGNTVIIDENNMPQLAYFITGIC